MGMFDSFYFADGLLPENNLPAEYEFQSKDLDCCLDVYKFSSDGSVKMFTMDDGKGVTIEKGLDFACQVYSYKDINDEQGNRIGFKRQTYSITVFNSRLAHVEKIEDFKHVRGKK